MAEKNKEILKDALKLLSICEVSESKLKQFLERHGYEESRIKETIKYLRKRNLINDTRLANFIVENCVRKKKGINYVRNALTNKGISEHIISETLARIYPDSLEYKIARRLFYLSKKPLKKTLYWLASRGFSEGTIEKLRGEIGEQQ
ncbi:MAG: RecX family transcriptional regulator [Candidatus Omnitrophica bacterium]|nr:RecX family transcriptional regulator [Candidatus Omnitrophota bacterium]